MVVERFGKLHAIHESGYFIAVPIVDRIAYVIDVRERAVDIVPQSAITRDNVSVEVSGNLFVRVVDPERAAYGARNPLYAVMMVSFNAVCLLVRLTWGSITVIIFVELFSDRTTYLWKLFLGGLVNFGLFLYSLNDFSNCSMPFSMRNPPCVLPSENSNSMKSSTIALD